MHVMQYTAIYLLVFGCGLQADVCNSCCLGEDDLWSFCTVFRLWGSFFSVQKMASLVSPFFLIVHIDSLKTHTVAVMRLDCLVNGMLGNWMGYTFTCCKLVVYCWMNRAILIFSTWKKRRVDLDNIKAFCSAPHPRNSSMDGAPLIALSAITFLLPKFVFGLITN